MFRLAWILLSDQLWVPPLYMKVGALLEAKDGMCLCECGRVEETIYAKTTSQEVGIGYHNNQALNSYLSKYGQNFLTLNFLVASLLWAGLSIHS